MAAIRQDGLLATIDFLHPDEIKKLSDLIIEMLSVGGEKTKKIPFLEKGESIETFKKLSAEQQARRFFGWLGKEIPQLSAMMKNAQVKTLGHVNDGDTVYLVSKLTLQIEGENMEVTDVLPMKKSGDEYRVLLKGDFSKLLKAVKQKLTSKAQ